MDTTPAPTGATPTVGQRIDRALGRIADATDGVPTAALVEWRLRADRLARDLEADAFRLAGGVAQIAELAPVYVDGEL